MGPLKKTRTGWADEAAAPPASQPAPPAAASATRAGRSAQLVVLVGGILVAVGSLLPWASLGFITVSGTQGDGVFTLAIGIVIAVIAAATLERGPSIGLQVALILLSLAALVIYWTDGSNMARIAAKTGSTLLGSAEVGTGIYLGGAGAFLSLAASLFVRRRVTGGRKTNQPAAPRPPI